MAIITTTLVLVQVVVGARFGLAQQHADGVAAAARKGTPVTWKNFTRAETDKYFKAYVAKGAFGKFYHIRAVTPIAQQTVIRMNRDTEYSMGIFDLTSPVTITMPDPGKLFQSFQVINEDEYTKMVKYGPGEFTLTQADVGTRYVLVLVRTLYVPTDPATSHALQDAITVSQASPGTFESPDWDQDSQDRMRDAINVLASTISNTHEMFGDVGEVNPVKFLMGAAYGWGGNPEKAAVYLNVVPDQNDGKTAFTLTVKDVPVDGFWSISLYNAKGFFQKNDLNAYSVNNLTATKEADGSVVIHFGGDPGQSNYLPIMEGWNYIVRLYRPRKAILDGTWKFPAATPVAN
jgi:hypothetical protein